ncbi:MAG TPA: hypothetical protein VGM88_34900 [Kofleriaceae bacterium]|jgi:hypothetical protein
MTGDIAVAGFLLTAEEWDALDPASRMQLAALLLDRHLDRQSEQSASIQSVGPLPPVSAHTIAD